ncbi:hypothetical protein KJ359_007300 [Pestalotiopsis sp. 9143b]|nr:hypothetical protein KJ359_007300 [Pestalotiopsis sp. 9143b]
MKFSAITFALATVAGSLAAPSAEQNPRAALPAALHALKRDTSGSGFVHLGSDNVLRSFDARMEVVDAIGLRSSEEPDLARRAPSDAVLAEVRTARARSADQTSKPRGRDELPQRRQSQSCVSEFCPDDSYCQGLSIYGYNCTSCLMVSDSIGNCQSF